MTRTYLFKAWHGIPPSISFPVHPVYVISRSNCLHIVSFLLFALECPSMCLFHSHQVIVENVI